MKARRKIRYVFTSSNTSEGFFTFIPKLLEGLKNVYILKGAAGSGKSTFIRLLGEFFWKRGYEVEFWISAIDPVNPDGVYFPQLKIAAINGSLPLAITPQYPGKMGEIINLDEYGNKETLKKKKAEIVELVNRLDLQRSQAYQWLEKAGEIKENIRNNIDHNPNCFSDNLHCITQGLMGEILDEKPEEKHYFASAFTADGMINYVDETSSLCKKRYIFKGPPGSGKSTIINEIASKAKEKGFLVEYYHCGLNAQNISMVIIPNLQVALIDAGDIEMVVYPWDSIINMADYLYDAKDPKHKEQSAVYRNYEILIRKAGTELEGARNSLKKLKKVYADCMNYELVDKKRNEVKEEILAMSAQL